MTNKERLREYGRLEVDIEAKIEQRAHLKQILRQAGDREEIRRQYEAADESLCRQLDRLFAEQRAIREAIERMDDETLRKLLEYKYINGWSLKKISHRMYISSDWLRHLHGEALTKIQFREARRRRN